MYRLADGLTVGERVARLRRQRGLSQEALAGLVARTPDWLGKVENNRLQLDKMSVIQLLADALDVSFGVLVGEPSLVEWTADSGRRTLPGLRAALLDCHLVAGLPRPQPADSMAMSVDQLARQVADVWEAFQASRFAYVTSVAPVVLDRVRGAVDHRSGSERKQARALLALTYQAVAVTLTKFGEHDLAWIAAERGLTHAELADDPVVRVSLMRAVTHSMLSTGRYHSAVAFTHDAANFACDALDLDQPDSQSVYGALFLAGAMAAARDDDRSTTQTFLREASDVAAQLHTDANHLWTAFGPTNVAMHAVSTAVELGDIQTAVDLGPTVNTADLPTERRTRHALEVARALSAWNRRDQALDTLLEAERHAPEQVRCHFITRKLLTDWIRTSKTKPSWPLSQLAHRMHLG